MNTMKWLVKREFWEHKGGFFWAPVWVGGAWTLLVAGTILLLTALGKSHGIQMHGDKFYTLSSALSPQDQQELIVSLATGYMGIAAPVFFVLTIAIFFFCIGSLYDDRRDRSALFWKSLPFSDAETVLSKIVMGIFAAPLIALAIATIASLLMLLAFCVAAAFVGLNFTAILAQPGLYLSPFEIAGMLPVYVMWALPTIGWLMLVSAWARTMPFLWAVGAPLLAWFLLWFFDAIFGFGWNVAWFGQHIVGRGLGGTVFGIWFAYHPAETIGETIVHAANGVVIHRHSDDMGTLMLQSWHVFATADLWIGVVAGAAMIFAAIRLRRWRDEG